MCGLLKQI